MKKNPRQNVMENEKRGNEEVPFLFHLSLMENSILLSQYLIIYRGLLNDYSEKNISFALITLRTDYPLDKKKYHNIW
jgi:hypothetical protein